MGKRLEGKVALVTGGARGIGRAIVLAFASEGAKVVINYHGSSEWADKTEAEAAGLGVKAIALQADVTSEKEVEGLFHKAVKEFGRLDILVNNAGTYSGKPITELAEEKWDEVFDLNLKAVYLASREAAKIMLSKKSGIVVNLASGGGLGPDPGYKPSVAYSASKAGVVMLTKTLARELAPYVRVNAIAPGTIDSNEDKPFSPEFKQKVVQRVPLGRVGETEDIARVAVFLVSDESSYMTGQTLSVDGGVIML